MTESPDQASVQRHANWVGLRTLRQRPKVVDVTEDGDPVFEVRSVRLVLRPDASCFSRLERCAKCGGDVHGSPVFAPGDLNGPTHSVICKECVRKAGVAGSPPLKIRGADRRQAAPRPVDVAERQSPTVPVEAEIQPEAVGVLEAAAEDPPVHVDDGRLAAVEAQLGVAMARLTELANVARSESIERRQADDIVRGQLRDILLEGLAAVRAEVAVRSEAEDARASEREDRVDKSHVATAELLDAQRAEVEASLRAGLTQVRMETSALREELKEGSEALTRLAEVHRSELVACLDGRLQPYVADLEELVRCQRRLEERLDALTRQVLDMEGGLKSSSEGGELMDALERQLQDAAFRLASRVASTEEPTLIGD